MKAFWMTMTLPMPTQTTIKSLDPLAIMSLMTGCRREQGSKKPSLGRGGPPQGFRHSAPSAQDDLQEEAQSHQRRQKPE